MPASLNVEFRIQNFVPRPRRYQNLARGSKAISFNISSHTHMHPQVELSNVVGYNPL